MKKLMLEVITPTGMLLRKEVDYVVVPTFDGMAGILPGHIRFMTKLTTGVLRYQVNGKEDYLAVSEGFMEVTPIKVIVLAEAAELGEDVDVEEALAEKREAELVLHRTLASKSSHLQAEIALSQVVAKLEAAKKYGGSS